jgi:flagellar protein FlbD
VITVTRLNGPQLAVNPDLIQRIESTPDTILTLIDGSKYVIAESPAEVADRIITFRAMVVARTMRIAEQEDADRSDTGDATVSAINQLRHSAPRGLAAVPEAQ